MCRYYYWNDILLRELRGELAVLVQCIYQLAVPHLQKTVRGHFARTRFPKLKLQIVGLARFAAAVQIQRVARGFISARESRRELADRFFHYATRIQCYWRRKKAYIRAHEKREVLRIKWENEMACKIQNLWRVKMARRRMEDRRQEQLKKRKGATQEWGTVTIQRIARGYIAKKIIVNRRIELKLHDRISRLADRYIAKGDLWQFLKSVDEDYRRFETTIDDILEREDTMATTFVSKVLDKRESENEKAWQAYEAVTEAHGAKKEQDPKKYSEKVRRSRTSSFVRR